MKSKKSMQYLKFRLVKQRNALTHKPNADSKIFSLNVVKVEIIRYGRIRLFLMVCQLRTQNEQKHYKKVMAIR